MIAKVLGKRAHLSVGKSLLAVAALVAAAAALSLVAEIEREDVGPRAATFSDAALGLEFDYRVGPGGYILEEVAPPVGEAELVRTLVLIPVDEALRGTPEGGEGPAVITVHVFSNPNRQRPLTWADAHVRYSGINLVLGQMSQASVGGATGIRYKIDGLYRAENVIVGHGQNVYVATGAFLEEDSALRRDFTALVASMRFIPVPAQG